MNGVMGLISDMSGVELQRSYLRQTLDLRQKEYALSKLAPFDAVDEEVIQTLVRDMLVLHGNLAQTANQLRLELGLPVR